MTNTNLNTTIDTSKAVAAQPKTETAVPKNVDGKTEVPMPSSPADTPKKTTTANP